MPWPEVSEYPSDLEMVAKWIYALLTGNQIISDYVGTNSKYNNEPEVYFGAAKPGATLPYCVFTFLGSNNMNTGSRKTGAKMRWNVAFVTSGDSILGAMRPLGQAENLFQRDQMYEDPTVIGSRVLGHPPVVEDKLDGGPTKYESAILVEIHANSTQYTQP